MPGNNSITNSPSKIQSRKFQYRSPDSISMSSSPDDFAHDIFRGLLDRDADPSGLAAYGAMVTSGNRVGVIKSILSSAEWRRRMASPFNHFNSSIDAYTIIQKHLNPDRAPKAGHVVNFLGVAVNRDFLPKHIASKLPDVEGPPNPANWHTDVSEVAAALRAVNLAEHTFTMIELGCGWGCWMNSTGVAARRRGLNVHLIGIEGDPKHISFAREACATNGFSTDEVQLYHGIAAASNGVALFPRQDEAGESWGLEPIFHADAKQRADALDAGGYIELPMISLADAIGNHDRIDLLHIDIQGGEAELIRDCLRLITEKVAYLVIGTHSRQIEGTIFASLLAEQWLLEIERPAILNLESPQPVVQVDGVQGWRNTRLNPVTQG